MFKLLTTITNATFFHFGPGLQIVDDGTDGDITNQFICKLPVTKIPATDSEIRRFAGNTATWTAPKIQLTYFLPDCAEMKEDTQEKKNLIKPSYSEWDSANLPFRFSKYRETINSLIMFW